MSSKLTFERRHGQSIAPVVDDLATLRISVFRDFPYLYDGDLDYERSYLQTYVRSANSLAFLVWEEDDLIGATTALPLADEVAAFQQPLHDAGFDVRRLFYFGESLLLPAYRGQGLGNRFFDERESWAVSCGEAAAPYEYCLFCAVERPVDHPARPTDYKPLDAFWRRRGYRPQPAIRAAYSWRDLGQTQPTQKTLQFWMRPLTG